MGTVFSLADLQKLSADPPPDKKVFSLADLQKMEPVEPQPHVSTKITYQGPVEDESDIRLLTPISEFGEQFWNSLTSGNMEMMGSAAEAFAVSAGNNPEDSIGRHVQNWVNENRGEEGIPISFSEGWEEGPLGVLSYLGGLVGSGLGSFGAQIAGAGVGAAVGSAVAPGPGTVIGGVTGMFGAGTLLNIGSTYKQLRDEGVDPNVAGRVSMLVGSGLGVIDSLAAGKLLGATAGKKIKKDAIDKIIKQLLAKPSKEIGRAAWEGMKTEGITETIQAAIQETTAATLTGNLDLKRRVLSTLEQGLGGALVGPIIGGGRQAGVVTRDWIREKAQQPESSPLPVPQGTLQTPPVPEAPPPVTPAPVTLPSPGDSASAPTTPKRIVTESDTPPKKLNNGNIVLYHATKNQDFDPADIKENVPSAPGSPKAIYTASTIRDTGGAKRVFKIIAKRAQPGTIPNEYLLSKDDVVGVIEHPKQNEEGEVDPNEWEAWEKFGEVIPESTPTPAASSLEGATGSETTLRTPNSDHNAHYRIVESESVQPSHNSQTFEKNQVYPEGVQERMYHTNKDAQNKVIKDSQNLKSDMVVNTTPTAIDGPPQTTPVGIVLGGNGRAMAIQRAYQQGSAEGYRKHLMDHAAEFGIDAKQIEGMKAPMLIREVTDAPADEEGMRVLGSDLNKDFKKALSENEQAVTSGKNLSKESADEIAAEFEKLGDKGSLRAAMADNPTVFRKSLLRDGVLNETDLPKYFTQEGALTETGKNFIEKAMVGSVVQDADLLTSMPKSLVAKVLRIVPQMIETGKRSDSWNITADVKEAIRQSSSAQIRGITIEDQLGQTTMFEEGPTPEVRALARVMSMKEKEISAAFKEFAKDARTDSPGQNAMFGAADPAESFERIFGAEPEAKVEATAAMEAPLAFAAGRPTLPSIEKAEMPKELVRRSEILSKLSKELGGIPIRLGRISRKKALGIYKPKAEVIRLRQATDISVAMHEIGHHLNKLLYGGKEGELNTAPLKEFSDELGKIATPGPKKKEGFAEFVRLYLTDPGEAMNVAPRFHHAFEVKMAENPDIRDVLLGTRKQIRRYLEQPAVAKAMAHIRMSSEQTRSRWSVDQIYKDIFNKQHPIELAVKKMESLKGEKLPTEKNAASLAQLVSGWSDRARLYLSKSTFDIDGEVNGPGLDVIIGPLVKSGKRQELDAYLASRRTVALAPRGIKTGIDLDIAKKTVQDLGSEEFERVTKDLYAFEDRLLDLRVQAGLLTKKEADAYRKANPDYVPLRKFFPDKGGDPLGSKGFLNLGGGKRIKGSEREVISPLESIVVDVESVIRDVDHHVAVKALVEQAASTEGGGVFAEKVPAKLKGTAVKLGDLKKALSENGINTDGMSAEAMESVATVFRPDLRPDPGENIVIVRNKKGERELWQLDPEVHKAFQSSSPVSSNVFTKILRGAAATLRTTATGTSLEFPMMNFFRDTLFAGLVSPDGFIPVLSSIKGSMLYLSNEKITDEFFRAGGGLSTNVEVALHQLGKSNNPLKKTPIMDAWQVLTFLGRNSEMATRMGYYNVARKAGKSPKQSALETKDLLNFSRWGAATEGAARYAPFWNSALQGTDKFRRALVEDPKGVTARGLAMITVPSILIYAANYGNKDYEEAPPWLKDMFWLIPTFDKKTPFIRMPKPHLPGMLFGSLPERAMDFARKRDPEAFDGVIESLLKTILPGQGGVPVPSLAIPIVEAITNYSFFRGRPIVSQDLKRFPAKYQSKPWTTEIAKETSKMLSLAGVEVSPLKIENTLFGITASTGRTAAIALNPLLRDKDAPEPPSMHWGDVPGARAFAVRPISGVSVQRLYDRLDKLKGMKAAEDLAKKHRWIEAKRMTLAERREHDILRKVQRRMSEISTRIRKLESSTKLSGDEKSKQIDKWMSRRREIAAETMAGIRKLKK